MGTVSISKWETEESTNQMRVSGELTTFSGSCWVCELAEEPDCHSLPADSSCESKVLAWIILISSYFDVK